MCFIAIDGGNVYIVSSRSKELSDTIMAGWKERCRKTHTYNVVLYAKLYKQVLRLPPDISLDDEFELLHDRYGAPLYDSDKFTESVSEAKKEYDKAKKALPNFVTWATECGCTVEETDRVLYI